MRHSKYPLGLLVFLTAGLITVFMSPGISWGHEVVGEVTPLMLHTNHALSFVRKGRGEKALQMIQKIYPDFEEAGRNGLEGGIRTNSLRVDRSFGTSSHETLLTAINEGDTQKLTKGLQLLSFLLMLEKFNFLQSTFNKDITPEKTRITMFWLGRNYFSYLLEPAMGETDPVEEKRLDRIMDRMLYSIEDKEWDKFIQLKEDLIRSLVRFFNLPVPELTGKRST